MKKSKRFIHHDGFTLIEVLVSMLCLSIISILLCSSIQIMKSLSMMDYASEDHISIMQLRFMLAQGHDMKISDETLSFVLHDEPSYLALHNHRLVKRGGYQIFIKDIDEVSFHLEGGCYYATWTRKKQDKKALLVCE